jgi:hypothetical protein
MQMAKNCKNCKIVKTFKNRQAETISMPPGCHNFNCGIDSRGRFLNLSQNTNLTSSDLEVKPIKNWSLHVNQADLMIFRNIAQNISQPIFVTLNT